MVAQFHGMRIENERFIKEATPMPTTPQSEPTVKDLLPLLTTAEDRTARIKAVLTPKRTVQGDEGWVKAGREDHA